MFDDNKESLAESGNFIKNLVLKSFNQNFYIIRSTFSKLDFILIFYC
jgi:hypothetical protein